MSHLRASRASGLLTKEAFIPAVAGKALGSIIKAPVRLAKAAFKSPGKTLEVGGAAVGIKSDIQGSGVTQGRMNSAGENSKAPNVTNF